MNFKVKLLSYTPLEVINTAIRTCWDSHDKSDNLGEKDLDLIKRVVLQNHHECYDEKTEVLTKEGWKYIKDVTNDDYVMTLNNEKFLTEFQKPLNFFKYKVNEKLLHFCNKNTDLLVTKNHNVFISPKTTRFLRKSPQYRLTEAINCLKLNHLHLNGGIPFDTSKNTQKYDLNFMKLVGFFIGDGHYKSGNYISFHLRKQRKINFLNQINKNVRAMAYDTYKIKMTAEELNIFSNCYDEKREKQIPFDLSTLTRQELESLYEGLINSDGYVPTFRNCVSYNTTSRKLLNQVQALILMLGYSANMNELTEKVRCYRINIQRKNHISEFNRTKDIERKKVIEVDYNGIVYCLEVPNHILLTRRNGKCVFSGNSTSEHCVFNFFIQGISRLNLMELTRHRLASYSVKSTRYTLKELRNEPEFTIKDKERASKYINLTDNENVDECSIKALENVRRLVNNAVNYNVTQDLIKYALPECYKTDLTFSINVRSLRNLLKLRTSKSAHFEIRNLAFKLYEALPEEFKFLFKDCVDVVE